MENLGKEMKIDLLEKKLRVYETTNDLRLSPNMFVIARIDGSASGQVVVITADPTYEPQLGAAPPTSRAARPAAAAASDDRLILPGVAPVAPPRIDLDTFVAAGTGGNTGEARRRPSRRPGSAGRPGCAVTGAWVASRAARWRGLWSRSTARRGFTCLTTFRSCSEVTIDDAGTTVHLAILEKKAGYGWLVEHSMAPVMLTAVRESLILLGPGSFPEEAALRLLVTQAAWQPSR